MASDRCLLLKKPKEMFLQALKIQKRDSYFQRSFGRKRKDLENDEMLECKSLRWSVTQKDESKVWKKTKYQHSAKWKQCVN